MTRVDVLSRLRQALLDLMRPSKKWRCLHRRQGRFGHAPELYTPLPPPRRHRRDKSGPFGSKNAPFCCQPRRQTAEPNSHTPATSTARLFAADKVLYRRQRWEPNRALGGVTYREGQKVVLAASFLEKEALHWHVLY